MPFDASWLVDAEKIHKLIVEFPLPLVLFNDQSKVEFCNQAFDNKYSRDILKSEDVAKLISLQWAEQRRTIDISDYHETPQQVLIYSVPLADHLFLLFDDLPGVDAYAELNELRKRLIELEELSTTDQLTGVWNRLPLERAAQVEIGRSQRYHHPLSIIFLDIDHFKKINDNFDHLVGDDVLKNLAQVMKSSIRSSDMLCRWGGEEFIIMANFIDRNAAGLLAEKVRRAIELYEFETVGQVTISAGVAEYFPGETLDEWLQRADTALYQAKTRGRNRIYVDEKSASQVWGKEEDESIARLIWHDYFLCGVETIDSDHRSLFDMANQMLNAPLDEKDRDQLFSMLDEMIDKISEHFDNEMKVLAEHHFPSLEAHMRDHNELLARLRNLKMEAMAGVLHPAELLEFIAHDVIARHVINSDREYYYLFEE